jgi:hypothetical protein
MNCMRNVLHVPKYHVQHFCIKVMDVHHIQVLNVVAQNAICGSTLDAAHLMMEANR